MFELPCHALRMLLECCEGDADVACCACVEGESHACRAHGAGHRSQGATFDGQVIIDVRSAFVPGLLYVMLSRVRSSKQLVIVGDLTPDMFTAVHIEGMDAA